LTDSWGLALEIAALLTGILVLARGKRWLPLWVVSMVVLAFTRDLTVVPLAAVAVVMLRERSGTAVAVFASGVVVALVPIVLFGSSYPDLIRDSASYSQLPLDHNSLAHDYWVGIKRWVNGDYWYLRHHKPVATLALISVVTLLVTMFRHWRATPTGERPDRFDDIVCGTLLGSVAFLLINPQFNRFRYELVTIPALAVGLAAAAQWVHRWGARTMPRAAWARPIRFGRLQR
jgi:hypothetical protein